MVKVTFHLTGSKNDFGNFGQFLSAACKTFAFLFVPAFLLEKLFIHTSTTSQTIEGCAENIIGESAFLH